MSEVKEIVKKEKETIKELLLKEARLSFDLAEKGISFNKNEIAKYRIAKSGVIAKRNAENLSFKLPHGVSAGGHFTPWTPYSIVIENGTPVLYEEKTPIGEITIPDKKPNPSLTEAILSDGQKFSNVMSYNEVAGSVSVGYSKECSLKETGEDCLFCTINVGEGKYTDRDGSLLTPKIVAEAYDLARKHGVGNHFKISGGFIPEQREVDQYIDVVEEIRKTYPDFYGCAVIGAPTDLTVLEKYKEAGYSFISTNLEVWHPDAFRLIVPGKERNRGGRQNWINTLIAVAEIFGKGHAHSSIIGGLEPKAYTLEGIEYLASKGAIAQLNRFRPIPETPLEGYRSPTADFHWELADKTTDIYIKYGFTLKELTGKHPHTLTQDLFRIKTGDFEGDRLTPWKYPVLSKSK